MKCLVAILGGLVLLVGLGITVSEAHNPAGLIYLMPGMAPENIPTIDGDVSDWAFMPEHYIFRTDEAFDHGQLMGGEVYDPFQIGLFGALPASREDFDFALYQAWAPSTNMLYVACDVTDSELHFPGEGSDHFGEDYLGWYVDSDHSGGLYAGDDSELGSAQQVTYTPNESIVWVHNIDPTQWSTQEPYTFGADMHTETGWSAECAFVAWDQLDAAGPDDSIMHTLTAGETIGWSIRVADRDPDGADDVVVTALGLGWNNASNFSDALLLSPEETDVVTAVEGSSWGAIKSTFK